MPLTLDTIRSLKANKSYYISNATGQIKEAGFWHKFKMYFSVGDAEKKTEKLLHEVKIALLAASGETDNAALTADIDNFSDNHNWCFSVSGRSLAAIANRFADANADKIASAEARGVCAKRINALVRDTVLPCIPREDWPTDFVAYLERAAEPLVKHPPTKALPGGRRVLDAAAFESELGRRLEVASTDLVHIAGCERLGRPCFDTTYLDHVFATFYDAEGVRNDRTEDDLRPAAEVRFEKARANAQDCPAGTDPAHFDSLARDALARCEKDPDALDNVVGGMFRILIIDGGKVRSREAVLKRVDDIRANYKEVRKAAWGNKDALRAGLAGVQIFSGAGLAFDPDGAAPAVTLVPPVGEKRRIVVECDRGQYLNLKLFAERTASSAVVNGETIPLGPGSKMKMTYAPGISVAHMEALERALAALDDFDLSAAERAASAPGRVPGRGANVQALLPPGIKLSPSFQTGSVEFVLN